MQLVTLNHPVDCGICDKAGECTLQDYHYQYNGSPSVSNEPKVRSTKFHPLSERIVLDNERCILCSRCVRFTKEISKVERARDHAARRYVAGARRRRPSARRRSLLGQRHRYLSGGRAALAARSSTRRASGI
jgi:dissimilatory sulfite reductase (desulfoviridin) alpha/beta subunit